MARGAETMALMTKVPDAFKGQRGQATVEFAVAFPLMLILIVIVTNIGNYLGLCASFDRAFPQQVRVCAAALEQGSNQGDAVSQIQAALCEAYEGECSSIQVSVTQDAWGNSTFSAVVGFEPSLFGLRFRSILFGLELAPLMHQTSYALNCYRPGVFV